MTTNSKPNRLINEKSPYLLQHANNPINWYSWSEEAFMQAKEQNKPIFLSIGYSTCHWCHVMEKESFEDEEVAKLLNDNFISIKVDREERPDIDHIYMMFCQMTTGHGGWPLTIFMTADKKPFYGGTYFPKTHKYGYYGLIELLKAITEKWNNERDKLIYSADRVLEALKNNENGHDEGLINDEAMKQAYDFLEDNFDHIYGGFGSAPKFPTPHNLMLLLRFAKIHPPSLALEMVEKTLLQMYKGGIFDHIGNGFSRYSTDKTWLAPHFEKMLYDNALLLMAYVEAYQLTNNKLLMKIAEKIIDYIKKNMISDEGAFYSAEDADSEGVEGKFYVWTYEEIMSILGKEEGNLLIQYYDISHKGNFEGKNILNLIHTDLEELENDTKLKSRLEVSLKRLYIEREKRIHPYKDDKILTSWNGLMIAALAIAGRAFNKVEYVRIAEKAAAFINSNLKNSDNMLMARYRDGEVKHLGYLDDYAFMLWAYIELYESTFNIDYLQQAIALTEMARSSFWDEDRSGFFLSSIYGEKLITNSKTIYDGAIPSGNAVMGLNLLRLSKMTGMEEYHQLVMEMFKGFGNKINQNPMSYTFTLMAKMFDDNQGKEIVIASENEEEIQKVTQIIHKRFMPFSVVLLNDPKFKDINPFIITQGPIENKTTIYICENFSCKKPMTDIGKLVEALD